MKKQYTTKDENSNYMGSAVPRGSYSLSPTDDSCRKERRQQGYTGEHSRYYTLEIRISDQ